MVAIAAALPLLALRGWPDPLRHTFVTDIFSHSALGIFVFVLVVWSGLFYWLQLRGGTARGTYLLCGLALGVFPGVVYFVVCALTSQPLPPLTLALFGVSAGLLAGFGLHRELPVRQYG